MDLDDGERQGYAVGVSTIERNGMLRLILDDLKFTGIPRGEWRHRCLYTFIDLDKARATRFNLSEEEFAGIGKTLIARIVALCLPEAGEDG